MVTTTTGIATEFITFSRASNATVTDSDGKIKWAPHNLLLASEQFDASSWTKTTTTVSANSVASPNGTTTADTLTAGGANSTALQSYTALNVAYTFGVWLKRKTGTGNIQIAADSGTWNTVTLTTDWTLFTVSQTPAAGSISAGVRIVTSGDEVYAWGAHLYRSDLGGMQANTSAYPMYNPTTPKNLLGYTEDFTTGWQRTGISAFGSGSVSNAIVAPNGLQTADKITPTAANAIHAINNQTPITIVSGTPYYGTVYVKAAEYGFAFVSLNVSASSTNAGVCVNLVDGTQSNAGGSGTYTVTSVGDGWWRVGIRAASTTTNAYLEVWPRASAGAIAAYASDGTSGIYLWGAQLSDSASLDAYSPVYGAAVTSAAYYGPRLDFDANGSALGLLVEEQRTNLINQSGFTNGLVDAGIRGGLLTATTFYNLLSNTSIAFGYDGTTSSYAYNAVTPAASTTYAFSTFVRMDDGNAPSFGSVSANSNLNDFVFVVGGALVTMTTVTIANVGNSIYRVSGTVTTTASPIAGIGVLKYNTNSNRTFRVTGYQLEAGSFATSYIPTGSATATRSADVASVSTAAFPYSATEGTLVANGTRFSTTGANCVIAELGDGGATNIFELYRVSGSANGALYVASGGVGSTITLNNAFPLNTPSKIGGVYKVNDFQASANGTLGTPVTSGAVPTAASNLYIGRYGGLLTNQWNGHIRQITYLPRRITNAELQSRTA